MFLKIAIPIAGIAAAGILFFAYATKTPRSITAEVKSDAVIYDFEEVTKSDLNVYAKPIIGNRMQIHDYNITNAIADEITVSYRTFNTTVKPDRVKCTDIKASYNAKAYEGESLSKNGVTLEFIYEDGTSYPIKEFSVPQGIVFSNKEEKVTVTSEFGNADFTVTPVKIKSIKTDYKYAIHLNEEFSKENVEVSLIYEDGTTTPMKSFDCDFEGKIKEETVIPIKTKYGECTLTLTPVPVKEIQTGYREAVYEGKPINKEAVFAKAIFEDGTETEITDFTVSDTENPILIKTDIPIHSEYGDATLTVDPIPVIYVTTDAGTVEVNSEITIHSIIFVYEDGASMEIKASDVKFLEDPTTISFVPGDNLFQIEYNGKQYTLTIPAQEGFFAGYSM